MIAPSLSPNTDSDDVLQALRMILSPTQWKEGSTLGQIRRWFTNYLRGGELAFFNSGRSAELALLWAFGIGEGDEVLVQAFTCVAVPNSVLWTGAKPVYVDIDETYNMDPGDAEKKITKNTKALIIQHTFGIPAQVDQLLALAKKYKLLVIEDCAHAFGATYQGKKIGTLGDAAFFSFGRDKVVSSVWGGAAYIKYQISNIKYQIKLKKYEQTLSFPSIFWIFQQLLHPIVFSLIFPLYDVGVGKLLLVVLQKLRLLSFPVYPEEKRGNQPLDFPAKYPNALASLLMVQLNKLDRLMNNRRARAKQYDKTLKSTSEITILQYSTHTGWLRYPVQVEDPENIMSKAKKSGIVLGNWYHNIVDPTGVDKTAVGYQSGTCPKAEYAAKHIVNLPTNISQNDAKRVLRVMLGNYAI